MAFVEGVFLTETVPDCRTARPCLLLVTVLSPHMDRVHLALPYTRKDS